MKRTAASTLLAILLAGCGSGVRVGGAVSSVQTPAPPVSQLTSRAPSGLGRALQGKRVGVTQNVDTRNAHLQVTVRAVIDPLRGAGVRLTPESRAVGVLVQIRSSGPAIYDSSATGDFRLVPSVGLATPALATRGVCRTPPQDFDRYITAGEDRVGCVVFMVQRTAGIEGVRFDPHAQHPGQLTWVLGANRTT